MIVKKVDIWHLRLGFLSPIKHNLATHQGSDNIVLRVTTDEAVSGYGEGIPRSFVTGEVLGEASPSSRKVLAPAISGKGFSFPRGAAPRPWRTL